MKSLVKYKKGGIGIQENFQGSAVGFKKNRQMEFFLTARERLLSAGLTGSEGEKGSAGPVEKRVLG